METGPVTAAVIHGLPRHALLKGADDRCVIMMSEGGHLV